MERLWEDTLPSDSLRFNPGSTISKPQNLEQVSSPLCSASPSTKFLNNCISLLVPLRGFLWVNICAEFGRISGTFYVYKY